MAHVHFDWQQYRMDNSNYCIRMYGKINQNEKNLNYNISVLFNLNRYEFGKIVNSVKLLHI